uniref:Transcriptional repressor of the lac operon n=1 Tax=Klebsiella pneumoniae TaxID=573 RepID=A0A7G9AB54_KLEPN|nr:Transcriptional repressor of the lac operon [Klebsiella pneumoniae]
MAQNISWYGMIAPEESQFRVVNVKPVTLYDVAEYHSINKAFFYIRSDEFSRRKLIIRDEIKISFPINIEMSVYSQKENQE